jgi:hypothetical protein
LNRCRRLTSFHQQVDHFAEQPHRLATRRRLPDQQVEVAVKALVIDAGARVEECRQQFFGVEHDVAVFGR